MKSKLQLFPVAKIFVGAIACALLLSACGGGGGSSGGGGAVTGVETPSKVSIANTN